MAKKKKDSEKSRKSDVERAIEFATTLRRDLLLQVAVDGNDDVTDEIVDAAVKSLPNLVCDVSNRQSAIVDEYTRDVLKAVEIAIPPGDCNRTMEALKAAADESLKGDAKLVVRVCVDMGSVIHNKRDIITRIGLLDDGKDVTS